VAKTVVESMVNGKEALVDMVDGSQSSNVQTHT